MSQTATVPDQQVVTRTIGDVTITLALPAGCPIPDIELAVYSCGIDDDARAAALMAFGMTDDHLRAHGGSLWCARHVDDGEVDVRAQVFLPVGAPDATEGAS